MASEKGKVSNSQRTKDVMSSWFSTCDRCGKEFVRAPEHLYKIKGKKVNYFCSYTCWTKAKTERGCRK